MKFRITTHSTITDGRIKSGEIFAAQADFQATDIEEALKLFPNELVRATQGKVQYLTRYGASAVFGPEGKPGYYDFTKTPPRLIEQKGSIIDACGKRYRLNLLRVEEIPLFL